MASQDTDQTTVDQLTLQDPVSRYPKITPPAEALPGTGLDAQMTPKADLGEKSYRGTGRLQGRKALITGGDSGIGAATAIAFAREGADVAITYLPEEERDAAAVATVVEAEGRTCARIPGDLRDKDFCIEVVEKAVDELGGLDILVNNGGKQVATDSIEDIDDEQLEATYDINILAMFRVVKAALPHLPKGAAIINTTSIQAYSPSETLVDYASTKAAINTFTKGLAQQLAPQGIRVNAVAPGPIWTPLQPSGGQKPEDLPEFGHATPLGRAGQPTEIAPAYVFLASPESSYVVGETLNVNGGMPTP
ncbi:SDR family oxidoreductase [Arsenicicoccus dermatophilus]|uniref:SDR family oxidoreductase n=1 Tax=Arsenicicoccus dermatophilus TaxID=1076331 RepID=UPI001F4C9CCB|nr:SDR family oxidoreductase [Arsenicicoccus dermatophilus]MCH8614142.1 SDR family oxidoreductase [Arsenicicoccus dermatophilus]